MSIDSQIVSALIDHLVEWAESFSPPYRVHGPLRTFEPNKGETYFMASFMPNATLTRPINRTTRGNQHRGIFQVMVCFPFQNQGISPPTDLAGDVIARFAQGTVLPTADGLKVKISTEPSMSGVLSDPKRPMIPVSIRYECMATA